MSDADNESNSGAKQYSWRQASITSSESDGPRIIVQTTSEDDEENDDITLHTMTLVKGIAPSESATTTDMGSDGTSCDDCLTGEAPVEVTPELANNLLSQVEEYLSDEGLTKDLFLLKHVKRHRDGYVSLKLLSGYKKVKKLSRDWRVLSLALHSSKHLELNDTATKVRRRNPLPYTLLYDAPASRSLVATNIPPQHATMAYLASLFGNYGPVASLQVVRPRPDGNVPPALQRLASRLPELSTTQCAVVEYEDVWGAARALHHMSSSSPITLHVLRRSRRPSHSSSRTSPTPTSTPRGRGGWYEHGVPPEELRQRLKGTRSRQRQHLQHQTESSASESDSSSYIYTCRRSSYQFTPRALPKHLLPPRTTSSTPASPRAPRRNDNTPIMRDPRGPDGTRGFSRVRS
ncbi:hypothetical protein Pmani_016124 [Petrolisthes manimaculis]|uniref:La-related protein 6 n=1 Tax=Petrolisthes manimaculis TaxID=1843537 RepID=A0AAE1PQX3_9EUCA|nr:hypothetical protein Pmani_016124 [Petrolisthes manimaculis]